VVHGGEYFSSSVVIDDEVCRVLRKTIDLAPLHTPPNLVGIDAAQANLPHATHVAVFDTAFHQTMPDYAYMYPLPRVLYQKHKIRRYGAHGTSHKYVSHRAAEFLGKPIEELKIISCHIGNGASITAVQDGKSVDTSMGMTPLEGLMMGTRCGNIDPAIVPFVIAKEDLTLSEVNSMMNKHSGLLGVSGVSSDMREVMEAMFDGNPNARLAIDMYVYRMKKMIGSYVAALNGVDVLIFTAGVGENSSYIREKVCEGLTFFGIEIDPEKNAVRSKEVRRISKENSKVEVLVVPTNEELMIARETKALV
jgi:acetate kinase